MKKIISCCIIGSTVLLSSCGINQQMSETNSGKTNTGNVVSTGTITTTQSQTVDEMEVLKTKLSKVSDSISSMKQSIPYGKYDTSLTGSLDVSFKQHSSVNATTGSGKADSQYSSINATIIGSGSVDTNMDPLKNKFIQNIGGNATIKSKDSIGKFDINSTFGLTESGVYIKPNKVVLLDPKDLFNLKQTMSQIKPILNSLSNTFIFLDINQLNSLTSTQQIDINQGEDIIINTIHDILSDTSYIIDKQTGKWDQQDAYVYTVDNNKLAIKVLSSLQQHITSTSLQSNTQLVGQIDEYLKKFESGEFSLSETITQSKIYLTKDDNSLHISFRLVHSPYTLFNINLNSDNSVLNISFVENRKSEGISTQSGSTQIITQDQSSTGSIISDKISKDMNPIVLELVKKSDTQMDYTIMYNVNHQDYTITGSFISSKTGDHSKQSFSLNTKNQIVDNLNLVLETTSIKNDSINITKESIVGNNQVVTPQELQQLMSGTTTINTQVTKSTTQQIKQ